MALEKAESLDAVRHIPGAKRRLRLGREDFRGTISRIVYFIGSGWSEDDLGYGRPKHEMLAQGLRVASMSRQVRMRGQQRQQA